ncbi:hypothetical protein L1987_53970 [Smallanthus sonchifolius]|uniref:Uncharacterized protein n=1 Tax=Smallanthus sonchifolius TaxID=185202 RepID=A0ACB9E5Y0_9ASTR|nr:hypothetical protein L1987_53970 [Smallanthus sonchifolius]
MLNSEQCILNLGRIEPTREKRKITAVVVAADEITVAEISMERLTPPPPPPPQAPPQPPKESFVRGYKFVWRILLISNLALGAYIFTRPRKKDATKKDKKHTELLSAPDIPDSERAAITPSHEPESTPESQWSKTFKW